MPLAYQAHFYGFPKHREGIVTNNDMHIRPRLKCGNFKGTTFVDHITMPDLISCGHVRIIEDTHALARFWPYYTLPASTYTLKV